MFEKLEQRIVESDPKRRRHLTIHVLIWSAVAGALCVGLWAIKVISHEQMDVITNILSWLAVSATCIDWILTSDVRAEK